MELESITIKYATNLLANLTLTQFQELIQKLNSESASRLNDLYFMPYIHFIFPPTDYEVERKCILYLFKNKKNPEVIFVLIIE